MNSHEWGQARVRERKKEGNSCNRPLCKALEGSWKLAGDWLGGLIVRRVGIGNN
jgi:hypothetical protein